MDLAWVESWRRPRSRAELALTPGERVVAGGTWLFSEPQPEVSGLVDLTELNWAPIVPLRDPDHAQAGVSIAATCTIEQLRATPWPAPVAALVRHCADALLMSFKIQHAATVGGNLCLGLPAGAMISLLAALEGVAVIWTPDRAVPTRSQEGPDSRAGEPGLGERRMAVTDFVHGVGLTSLAPGEILRSVEVPQLALEARYAFRRVSLTDHGRSAALVIARRTSEGVRLLVTASTPAPVVIELGDSPVPADVERAVGAIGTWHDDVHGAPDWRAAQTARLALEAIEELAS